MIRPAFINCLSIIFILGFIIMSAQATVIFTASGTSAKGVAVSFEARLTISGDILTVQLVNNSPVNTLNPDDALTSLYFDILGTGNNRPVLTYLSAFGDVYKGVKNNSDILIEPGANLKANKPGDNNWQFKNFDAAFNPFLGFGIGTVGNSNLAPNNFNGNIVDGIDYAIYKGDVTTQNLNGRLLVKNTATFTFTGLAGFTEADIMPTAAFGLGTSPDSLLLTPEPTTIVLFSAGAAVLLRKLTKKQE